MQRLGSYPVKYNKSYFLILKWKCGHWKVATIVTVCIMQIPEVFFIIWEALLIVVSTHCSWIFTPPNSHFYSLYVGLLTFFSTGMFLCDFKDHLMSVYFCLCFTGLKRIWHVDWLQVHQQHVKHLYMSKDVKERLALSSDCWITPVVHTVTTRGRQNHYHTANCDISWQKTWRHLKWAVSVFISVQ